MATSLFNLAVPLSILVIEICAYIIIDRVAKKYMPPEPKKSYQHKS